MPVLGLHHAQVFYPAGEESAARRFYVDHLGLAELPRPATLPPDGLWFAVPGGGQIHLSAERDLHLHPRRHFALRVDDLARTRASLGAHGVRFEEAVEIPGWKRCYVFDPFGNKIELDETE